MTKIQFQLAMDRLNDAIELVETAYKDEMTEYGDSRLNRTLAALSQARIKLTQYGIKVNYIPF